MGKIVSASLTSTLKLLRSLGDERNEKNLKLTSKCSSDSDTSLFPSPRVVSRRQSKSISSRRGKSVRSSSTFFFLDFFKLQCLSIYFSLFCIETKLSEKSSNFFLLLLIVRKFIRLDVNLLSMYVKFCLTLLSQDEQQ